MTERNITWVVCEMDQEMKNDVQQQVNKAIDVKETEKEISECIKTFFDKKYSPNWHCVVGKHFASYATYTSKHYIFFYIGQMAILLCKLWRGKNKYSAETGKERELNCALARRDWFGSEVSIE